MRVGLFSMLRVKLLGHELREKSSFQQILPSVNGNSQQKLQKICFIRCWVFFFCCACLFSRVFDLVAKQICKAADMNHMLARIEIIEMYRLRYKF